MPRLTVRESLVILVSGAGESEDWSHVSWELQSGLAAEGGVGLIVLHQEGDVGFHDDRVRGAAKGDQLQEEPAVGPDVLLAV